MERVKKGGSRVQSQKAQFKKGPQCERGLFRCPAYCLAATPNRPEGEPTSQEEETNKIENLPLEEQSKVQRISAPGCEARGGALKVEEEEEEEDLSKASSFSPLPPLPSLLCNLNSIPGKGAEGLVGTDIFSCLSSLASCLVPRSHTP